MAKRVSKKVVDSGKIPTTQKKAQAEALKLIKSAKEGDQLVVAFRKDKTTGITMVVHSNSNFAYNVGRKLVMENSPLASIFSGLEDALANVKKPAKKK